MRHIMWQILRCDNFFFSNLNAMQRMKRLTLLFLNVSSLHLGFASNPIRSQMFLYPTLLTYVDYMLLSCARQEPNEATIPRIIRLKNLECINLYPLDVPKYIEWVSFELNEHTWSLYYISNWLVLYSLVEMKPVPNLKLKIINILSKRRVNEHIISTPRADPLMRTKSYLLLKRILKVMRCDSKIVCNQLVMVWKWMDKKNVKERI